MLGYKKLKPENILFFYLLRHIRLYLIKALNKRKNYTGLIIMLSLVIFITFITSWFYWYGFQAYIDDILFEFSISSLSLLFAKFWLLSAFWLYFVVVLPYKTLGLINKADRITCMSQKQKNRYWILQGAQFTLWMISLWLFTHGTPMRDKSILTTILILCSFFLKPVLCNNKIFGMPMRFTLSFYSTIFLFCNVYFVYILWLTLNASFTLNNDNSYHQEELSFCITAFFWASYFTLQYFIAQKNKQKTLQVLIKKTGGFSFIIILMCFALLVFLLFNVSKVIGLSGFHKNIAIKANRISYDSLIQAGFWGNPSQLGTNKNIGSFAFNNDQIDLYNAFLFVNLGKFKIITSSPCARMGLVLNDGKPISLTPISHLGLRCSLYFEQFRARYNSVKEQYQKSHKNMIQYQTNIVQYASLLWVLPHGKIISNQKKAYQLWHQAARLGNPFAQYTLGVLHYYGYKSLCPKSLPQSIYWFKHSAHQEYIPAMEALSLIYTQKYINLPLAYYWLFKASALNDDSVYKRMNALRVLLTKKQLKKVQLLISKNDKVTTHKINGRSNA